MLIDCGMFQGAKEWRERNWQPMPVPASGIDAVILTHAHLDHCGWIPRLVREGFRGPVYATPSTIDLCGIILPDSGHLQEEDARFYNRHKKSKHDPALPLYTLAEAQDSLQHFRPVQFEETRQLSPEVSFRFVPAAHILGSAMVELTLQLNGQSRKLLFSGDIGRVRDQTSAPGKVVRSGPTEGEAADILVMESTYGNRQHPTDDPRPKLAEIIRHTVQRGGWVIVPAFAVERTQKFLFMLKELMESGQIPAPSGVLRQPHGDQGGRSFPEALGRVQRRHLPVDQAIWLAFAMAGLYLCPDHRRLEENQQRKLSRNYRFLQRHGDRRTNPAPPDAAASRSEKYRDLYRIPGAGNPGGDDQERCIRGAHFQRDGAHPGRNRGARTIQRSCRYSGAAGMVAHLFLERPATTYLVHGEPAASSQLRDAMTKELGWNVQVAEWMEKVMV